MKENNTNMPQSTTTQHQAINYSCSCRQKKI